HGGRHQRRCTLHRDARLGAASRDGPAGVRRLKTRWAVLILCAACSEAPPPPPVSRAFPAVGTTMSAAAWGADTTRLDQALDAVRDTLDRPGHVAAVDSLRREIRRRTGVTVTA